MSSLSGHVCLPMEPIYRLFQLTHWGRMTHICVGKLTTIGSDNGLSPWRRQAFIWTNGGILWIGSLGTKFNEILIKIQIFSFIKMHLKMSSAQWRPFGLGLDVLTEFWMSTHVYFQPRRQCNIAGKWINIYDRVFIVFPKINEYYGIGLMRDANAYYWLCVMFRPLLGILSI